MNNMFMNMLAQTAEQEAPQSPAGADQSTQTVQPDPSGEGLPGDGEQKQPSLLESLMPIFLILMVVYFVMFRGQKKKQNQQRTMLDQLKRNDRIRTIGGILGTVVDVRENEVVIKIDESNNTKMKIVRNAIATVITDKAEAAK